MKQEKLILWIIGQYVEAWSLAVSRSCDLRKLRFKHLQKNIYVMSIKVLFSHTVEADAEVYEDIGEVYPDEDFEPEDDEDYFHEENDLSVLHDQSPLIDEQAPAGT